MKNRQCMIGLFYQSLVFLLLAALPLSVWGDDVVDQAIAFSKSLNGKVLRTHLLANWTEDGKYLWYQTEDDEGSKIFVKVDLRTGQRFESSNREDIGLGAVVPRKSSESLLDLSASGRSSLVVSITIQNHTDEELEIIWVDFWRQWKPYYRIGPQQTKTFNTLFTHNWLARDPRGVAVASFRAKSLQNVFIVDSPSKARDKDIEKTLAREQSPDGRFKVTNQPQALKPREIVLIESRPKDQLYPREIRLPYFKPGDPLPKPKLLVSGQNGQSRQVSNDLFPNPFSQSGRLSSRWAPDSDEFYVDYNQRGHQLYRILAIDPQTLEGRTVVEETSETFIDYHHKIWRHWLDDSDQLLWMSERTGYAHLYRYQISTGRLINPITRGEWVVREVLKVDAEKSQIWFMASGLVSAENPYHRHLCRVNFDGSGLIKLTQGAGDHTIEFSPSGEHFIATWSRPDQVPVRELRNSSRGRLIARLDGANGRRLRETGWQPPERFVAKGRDGETDIHGIIVKPIDFDPKKSYPVIENIYVGPQGVSTPTQFTTLNDLQLLAKLGFVVVKLDGMGTGHRGKAFQNVCWKNLKDAGFPDRIKWIQSAAKDRPWMDLSRVGIYGSSAGGQNAMRALLDHSDFYHVAVAAAGCHDNRMDKIIWNEQWMGWPVDESYVRSSNVEDAHKLEGKLLLVVGELDRNVDPANTYQAVHALQKAGKAHDFIMVPGGNHYVMNDPYAKKRWLEFFVEHLLELPAD